MAGTGTGGIPRRNQTGSADKDIREHTDYIHTRADYKQDTGGHKKRAGNSLKQQITETYIET